MQRGDFQLLVVSSLQTGDITYALFLGTSSANESMHDLMSAGKLAIQLHVSILGCCVFS
jgi:hypothetical protein